MKQPELGKKLVELRQLKGVTQQEISEACNVSMRTIQRIELGQTEPRPMTLKLILDYLEEDYQSFVGETRQERKKPVVGNNSFKIAAMAGIVYFLLGIPESYMDINLMEGFPSFQGKVLFVTIKLLVVVTYTIFMNGFVQLGKKLEVKALEFVSYTLIIVTATFYMVWIGLVLSEVDGTIVMIGESISVGTLSVFFGASLYKLRSILGDAVLGAAVLEVLLGISLIFVFSAFLGFLLLIPANLVEIYLLYSASGKSEADLSLS